MLGLRGLFWSWRANSAQYVRVAGHPSAGVTYVRGTRVRPRSTVSNAVSGAGTPRCSLGRRCRQEQGHRRRLGRGGEAASATRATPHGMSDYTGGRGGTMAQRIAAVSARSVGVTQASAMRDSRGSSSDVRAHWGRAATEFAARTA